MNDSIEAAALSDLVASAATDETALRTLYRHFHPRVYAYVAARIRTQTDAEDVVGEIFMRMLRGLSGFRVEQSASFPAWLFRIAHNEVARFYKKRGRSDAHEQPDDDLNAYPATNPTPEQYLIHQEQAARVLSAIRGLAPRRQEVVMLRFYGGLSNKEIAHTLGLDERSIASHLSRALNDLRQRVGQQLGEGSDV